MRASPETKGDAAAATSRSSARRRHKARAEERDDVDKARERVSDARALDRESAERVRTSRSPRCVSMFLSSGNKVRSGQREGLVDGGRR